MANAEVAIDRGLATGSIRVSPVEPRVIRYYDATVVSSGTEQPTQTLENVTRFKNEASEWLRQSESIQNPSGLHLINTRSWLNQLSTQAEEPITIGAVPEGEWAKLFDQFDTLWFMGIYKPSEASRQHSLKWCHEYEPIMPDLNKETDVDASPFAIPDYSPNPSIAADWEEWDSVVDMLHSNGKKAFLDLVPNHVGLDHPWTQEHPEYFVQGSSDQVVVNPGAYKKFETPDGQPYYLAHGKDPNFPEWHDTLQLNYANPDLQDAMEQVVLDLVDHADGLRCDMAMLLNAGTFLRTWGHHLSDAEKDFISINEFWPRVTAKAKAKAQESGRDDFYFVAEAYWDKEELGVKGFDYIYGKDFYDHLERLANGEPNEKPEDLRYHLIHLMTANNNGRPYKDVLFTENHDEQRAPQVFGLEASKAATVIAACVPDSIFLFNQGQEEGRMVKPPMQVNRFPTENSDPEAERFYRDLLRLKQSRLFQEGSWKLAHLNLDDPSIIAQQVEVNDDPDGVKGSGDEELRMGAVVVTNYSEHAASCRVPDVGQDKAAFVYSLTEGKNVKNPDIHRDHGMFVGLSAWETQVLFYMPSDGFQTTAINSGVVIS